MLNAMFNIWHRADRMRSRALMLNERTAHVSKARREALYADHPLRNAWRWAKCTIGRGVSSPGQRPAAYRHRQENAVAAVDPTTFANISAAFQKIWRPCPEKFLTDE